jgi:hypothetical protein
MHVRPGTLHVRRSTYSLLDVTKRSLLRWSVTLLFVVGTSASYGAARQAVSELEALSCCAHDCGHAEEKRADPSRCCGIASPDTAAASVAPTPRSPVPALVAVPFAESAALAVPPSLAIESPVPAAARAAPIFLLTHSLRI